LAPKRLRVGEELRRVREADLQVGQVLRFADRRGRGEGPHTEIPGVDDGRVRGAVEVREELLSVLVDPLEEVVNVVESVRGVEHADLGKRGGHRRAALEVHVDVTRLDRREPLGIRTELAVGEEVDGEVEVLSLDPFLEQLHSALVVRLRLGLATADLDGEFGVLAGGGGRWVVRRRATREENQRHGKDERRRNPTPSA
jgi:hypothetical protein